MQSPNPKLVYIETYGCSANQNNSEILAGILSRANFIITNNIDLADIVIVNTCVVKEKTESKIKRRIQDLKQFSHKKLIIIAGCMPQIEKIKKIKNLNSKAVLLGTHHFKNIINLIRDYYEKKLDEKKQQSYLNDNYEIKLLLPKIPNNKLISIHQISEGCLGLCSYCKVRLAKGKLFSYPKEDIIKSIENDLQNGAKEIWLTSQDNGAYGLDWKAKKHELPELLKEILNLKHRFKLRLGMTNPNNAIAILDELIEIYKDKKIYKFIHIPVQSASNKILKDMNRLYTIEEAEKIIQRFRKEFPNGVIATDIIVGYPTEKQEDHEKNVDFIKKYKPDVFNLSKFSSHKQTPAGKLKKIKNSIIKNRTKEIMQAHKQTAKDNKKRFLNKIIEVFINKRLSDNLYQARDENYNLILIRGSEELIGRNMKVKITNIGIHHMIGELQ